MICCSCVQEEGEEVANAAVAVAHTPSSAPVCADFPPPPMSPLYSPTDAALAVSPGYASTASVYSPASPQSPDYSPYGEGYAYAGSPPYGPSSPPYYPSYSSQEQESDE